VNTNLKKPENAIYDPEIVQTFDAKIKAQFTRHLGLRILNSPLHPSIGKILFDFTLNGVDFYLYDLVPKMPVSMWMGLCPRPLAIMFLLDGARPLADQYAIAEFDKIVFHYYSEYSDAFIGLQTPLAILVHTSEGTSLFTEHDLVQSLNLSNCALKWRAFFLNLSDVTQVYEVWNWIIQDVIGLSNLQQNSPNTIPTKRENTK